MMTCMRARILILCIAVAFPPAQTKSTCVAADDLKQPGADDQQPQTAIPAKSIGAYMGIIVEELPPYVLTHLPNVASSGQGELIRFVIKGSPAAAAGLKEHDILLTYDDQKLFSSEQLIKLIASDQPGREVQMGILREGRKETVIVQLASLPATRRGVRAMPGTSPRGTVFPPEFRRGEPPSSVTVPSPETPRALWHHLDSITIKWLEGDRFHATLTHFGGNGQLEKHEYQGNREEIRKLIDADDDLKPNERRHLLRCLDIPDHPNPWKLFDESQDSGF